MVALEFLLGSGELVAKSINIVCFNQLKIDSKEHLELFYINHGTLFKTFVLQVDLKYRIFDMTHTV